MNEKIKVVCAWCNKVLVDNPGPISHGICQDCRQAYFPEETAKMKMIIAPHEVRDQAKLAYLVKSMADNGWQGEIKAVYIECNDVWIALEGSHRLAAAYQLGLSPSIKPINYDDTLVSSITDNDTDQTVEQYCDSQITGYDTCYNFDRVVSC